MVGTLYTKRLRFRCAECVNFCSPLPLTTGARRQGNLAHISKGLAQELAPTAETNIQLASPETQEKNLCNIVSLTR